MSGNASHKLNNALEGALAGGGDPPSAPLYIFGPFLKLIVVAGVAEITFGASVWLVVLTIAVVSAVYRLVMKWVTDGSGGSGLCEEEFGGWAAKINAAITFIEYTLTFLVSMAALVTFIADRFPVLNASIAGIQYRTLLAIALSVFTGWLVNRGPKIAARAFGPATASVLALLWIMIIATIWQHGIHFPKIDLRAFQPANLSYTLGGYARILALMTGIEIFANLVAAYSGTEAQKGRKAFASLLIIMGTASLTMLIVGPAILQLSDPTNAHVSVFTQTMDQLLPAPLPYLGTLAGVAVLISAAASSAQGLQNLALGLRERNYIPYSLGKQNRFEVADKPVWIEVGVASLCFLLLGTHEGTYLAVYAAGIFILLSLTGWAVTKRLLRKRFTFGNAGLILGTSLAALLTTSATVVIFAERFTEGAWTYFLFIPLCYAIFSHFRHRLGEPATIMDYLGLLDATQVAGFGFGQYAVAKEASETKTTFELTWKPEPIAQSTWRSEQVTIRKVIVLLDGPSIVSGAISVVTRLCKIANAKVLLLASRWENNVGIFVEETRKNNLEAKYILHPGSLADATVAQIKAGGGDLVILITNNKCRVREEEHESTYQKLIQSISLPILAIRTNHNNKAAPVVVGRIIVALDGSIKSERCLPYARLFAKTFNAELILVSVPAVPQVQKSRNSINLVHTLEAKANQNMAHFLSKVADPLRADGIRVRTIVTGSFPAPTILSLAKNMAADLIMLSSRGRGCLEPSIGSVAMQIVENADKSIFVMPIPPSIPREHGPLVIPELSSSA